MDGFNSDELDVRLNSTELYYKQVSKVLQILLALRSFLDFENGEPVASQLDETYTSLLAAIRRASESKNLTDLRKLASTLEMLLSAWKEAT